MDNLAFATSSQNGASTGSLASPTGGPAKKRVKTTWSDEEDRFLVRLLRRQVELGKRAANSFKRESLVEVAVSLNSRLNTRMDENKVKHRMKTLKKNYFEWRKVINASGFGWNPANKCIDADDQVWADYVQCHPDAAQFRGKSLHLYEDLYVVYGDNPVEGRHAMSGHVPTPCKDVDYVDVNIGSGGPLGNVTENPDDTDFYYMPNPSCNESQPSPLMSPPSGPSSSRTTRMQSIAGDERMSTSSKNSGGLKRVPRTNVERLGALAEEVSGAVRYLADKLADGQLVNRYKKVMEGLRACADLQMIEIYQAVELVCESERASGLFLSMPHEYRTEYVKIILQGFVSMPSKKYVVFKGREPGVYPNWEMARVQVERFPGAYHKSFYRAEDAVSAYEDFKRATAKDDTKRALAFAELMKASGGVVGQDREVIKEVILCDCRSCQKKPKS